MIDVGMSYAYGGQPAAWRCELRDDGTADVAALYEDRAPAEPPALCEQCARTSPLSRDWDACQDYCAPGAGRFSR